MKKKDMLLNIIEFLTIDGFAKNYWGKYTERVMKDIFKKGQAMKKAELEHVYNLYLYGYYNQNKYKIYYDIVN